MNKRKKQEEEKKASIPPKHSGIVGRIESLSLKAASKIPFPSVHLWVLSYFQPAWVHEKESGKESYARTITGLFSIGVLSAAIALLQYSLFNLLVLGPSFLVNLGLTLEALFVAFAIQPLFFVAMSFVIFAIFFVLARLLGGKGSFKSHCHLLALIFCGIVVLTAIPSIFQLVPILDVPFQIIGLIITLYSFYSYYLALRAVHSLSTLRAAAVVAIVFVLMLVLLALFSMASSAAPALQ